MTQTRKNSSLSQTINVSTSGNGDTISIPSSGIVNISGVLNVNNISVSVSGHSHASNDITNFNSSVSGLLPVKNIIAGTGISLSISDGAYTINSSGTSNLNTEDVMDIMGTGLIAGTGISVVYNDTNGTITVSLAGGSSEITQGNATLVDGSGNNYNPGTTADTVRISGINNAVLTGLSYSNYNVDAGLFINVGTGNITLKHNNSSSNATNRFLIPWAGDYVTAPNGGAFLVVRDKTNNVWRII